MTLEITKRELELIIMGMTTGQYPINLQKEAFDLVMKLRDMLHERT